MRSPTPSARRGRGGRFFREASDKHAAASRRSASTPATAWGTCTAIHKCLPAAKQRDRPDIQTAYAASLALAMSLDKVITNLHLPAN